MGDTIAKGPRGHPTAERAAEIANAIVVAALTLFSDRGSDFSMDEVAATAGVSKQAIYRRFDGKNALMQFALEAGSAILVGDVTDDLPSDPVEALELACTRLFARGGPGAIGVTLHLEAEAIRSPLFRESLVKSRRALDHAIGERLRAVATAGRLVEGTIRLQTQVLLDLLLGANIRLNAEQMFSAEEREAMFAERWAIFRSLAIQDSTETRDLA